MELILKPSVYWGEETKDVLLKKDGKTLRIMYGGNQDLYMDIFGGELTKNEKGNDTSDFVIESSDDEYSLFEELYTSIITPRVYYMSEFSRPDRLNTMLKYSSAYNELVDNGEINFYSDNIYNERANLLKITKEQDKIKLSFIANEKDPSGFGFSIRICNDGSKYQPFNVCFMHLFNSLSKSKEEEME